MRSISILGAGRSSVFLIEYLAKYCKDNACQLKVYDRDFSNIKDAIQIETDTIFSLLDINSKEELNQVIASSWLVISMLPAFMHPEVAEICLRENVHMATASYVSDYLLERKEEIEKKGLVFINEMGLDPGIDHMSAMRILDDLKDKGAVINGFKSYTGGLVADADDDNPWKYKFSWNPRNVVLAAQGAPALYLENSSMKISSYQNVFEFADRIEVPGYGALEAYPNRDSLKYIQLYGLSGLKDMLRGTFRKIGFCKSWDVFVKLGMTDDSLKIKLEAGTSLSEWLRMYLPGNGELKSDFVQYVNGDEDIVHRFEWLGFFGGEKMNCLEGTSAFLLENLLKGKWVLKPDDRDLIVMMHIVEYALEGQGHTYESVLVLEGDSGSRTAMAKTVGLPLAIACKMLLEDNINATGIVTPLDKSIYNPILDEMESLGLRFVDRIK